LEFGKFDPWVFGIPEILSPDVKIPRSDRQILDVKFWCFFGIPEI
jgi:hypothetical protein